MLWTYKNAAKVATEHLNQLLLKVVRENQAQILNQVPKETVFEGNRHGIVREDGSSDHNNFGTASATGELKLDEDRPARLSEAEEAMRKMGLAFAKDLSEKFFKTIDEQLTRAGRKPVIGEMSPDLIIQTVDDLQIEFTPEGRPVWPQLHAGKEAGEKFSKAWSGLINSPEHTERLNNIMLRKRDEWVNRENRKYLAD